MNNTILQKKSQIEFNTHRVCDLLQWTIDRYNQHQYNAAIDYLVEYYKDEEAVSKVSAGIAFWGWFISLWDARNEVFLETLDGRQDEFKTETLRKLYGGIHQPESLACEIAPPAAILPKDFVTIKMQMQP